MKMILRTTIKMRIKGSIHIIAKMQFPWYKVERADFFESIKCTISLIFFIVISLVYISPESCSSWTVFLLLETINFGSWKNLTEMILNILSGFGRYFVTTTSSQVPFPDAFPYDSSFITKGRSSLEVVTNLDFAPHRYFWPNV